MRAKITRRVTWCGHCLSQEGSMEWGLEAVGPESWRQGQGEDL
jgi:hypothetical protein